MAEVKGGLAAGTSALVEDEAPQLAKARKSPACAMFLLIQLLPPSCRREPQPSPRSTQLGHDATLQLTLAGHRGSAVRRLSRRTRRPRAREAFGGKKALFDRLSGVFDNAGIARRHIVAPLDWYGQPHGWHDRNAVYLEAAESLFIDAATAAIEKAGLKPADIDGVVTVSTTGIATPSLEARVAHGSVFATTSAACRSSALAARAASTALRWPRGWRPPSPAADWLFVTVETCSISIRLDSDDPAAVVATALFGDGAAAAVVTSGEHSLARITGSAEKLWPDTLRIMGWDVEDPGLAVVFDRAIPPFIEAELADAVDGMCANRWASRAGTSTAFAAIRAASR